jgi:predicted nucleotidyltransferase
MTGLGFWLALLQKIWYPSSMEKPQANDHILAVFKAAIDEIYGSRLDRAVLFGSRANGQAQADSDYDVALFLNSMPDRWIELDRLAALRVKLLDETGAFFDIKPYPMAAYLERSPLMHEIRREGIDL